MALLSLGRLMYFGKRREMLPYFAFIEYPCPAYKNPADYYREYPYTVYRVPLHRVPLPRLQEPRRLLP